MITHVPKPCVTAPHYDAIVMGAGAAGLFCAGAAGQLGVKVLLIDHAPKVAEKIRISGGGRANFTNRDVSPNNFISQNPHFCRSALARYTPADFLALVQRYGLSFHEKHKGQLFFDRSAQDLIDMLLAECEKGGVTRWQPCRIQSVAMHAPSGYLVQTDNGPVSCDALVVATGGLSIPKIGATDFGHQLARQFGIGVVTPRPALVPLTFDSETWKNFSGLAGLSLPVTISTGTKKNAHRFHEDLLLTHRGLSGPAVLQISSYWTPGQSISIDLSPQLNLNHLLKTAKTTSKKWVSNELAQWLPTRLVDLWVAQHPNCHKAIADTQDKALNELTEHLQRWELTPSGTEGYAKAEVTLGGVDTRYLSSQTMESKQAGLYFIGEVVDVTGWLGGYNFQWAWSSAMACAQSLSRHQQPQRSATIECD